MFTGTGFLAGAGRIFTYNTGIAAAEGEIIAHENIAGPFSSGLYNVIAVRITARSPEIGRGWQTIAPRRRYDGNQFHYSGGTETMTGDRFGGAYGKSGNCIPENKGHRPVFAPVIRLCSRTVNIDIAYIVRPEAGVMQGPFHG
jgi:hypothetical protein